MSTYRETSAGHHGRVVTALACSLLHGCGATVSAPTGPGTDAGVAVDVGTDAGSTLLLDGATPPSGTRIPLVNNSVDSVDILLEVGNSSGMGDNQTTFAASLQALTNALTSPSVDPTTGNPRAIPVRSLHVGVISTDLGTPGSSVPSCANSDLGDDGLLNPIRNGQAMRMHEPWTTLGPGVRPARCMTDPNEYPNFLTFDAMSTDPPGFRDDTVCNILLASTGCGPEAQLEAAYRALVVHNPRAQAGNMDANAGFVRDNAVLAIIVLSDRDDGSVRDCRYAEHDSHGRPMACIDALSVYDSTSPAWSSTDLRLRFYLYTPGTSQDPTWPLSRYIDPTDPSRGFTGLKPGHPERVTFSAITGVPLTLPMTSAGGVDWSVLLGRIPDGSDGLVALSAEGPISMRQRNMDPNCSTRTVPSCRRQGTTYDPAHPSCDNATQYFAWPSRRIAQVARVFDETYHNGYVASICATDYTAALSRIAAGVQQRLAGRCLPVALPVIPAGATAGTPITVNCTVIETLPASVPPSWCTAAHGRTPGPVMNGLPTCTVQQVRVPLGSGTPPSGGHGFLYDTSYDSTMPDCHQRISFTAGDGVISGGSAVLQCP